jgi:outer membrane protein assembly factor BamA
MKIRIIDSTNESTRRSFLNAVCSARRARSSVTGLFLACLIAFSLVANGQERPGYDDSLTVHSIKFEGNTTFSPDELLGQVFLKESPSGFRVFIYNHISERFGSEPQFFDYDVYSRDIENLKQFYTNNGFFLVAVEGGYKVNRKEMEVDVTYRITEGPASMIDSLVYKYSSPLPPDVMELIDKDRLVKAGRRYSAEALQSEIQRVLTVLGDNGYPNSTSDNVVVERKLSNNNLVVRLPFYFGRRLHFGVITEDIRGVDELNLTRSLLYDRLEFRTGEVWSNSRKETGIQNLHRLGVFSNVQVLTQAFPSQTDTVTSVPVTLLLYPKKRHDLEPGILFNNYFGRLNAGLEITHVFRNVFGAAQTLTTKLGGLTKLPYIQFSPFDIQMDAYQLQLQVRYDQPYFSSSKNSFYLAGSYLIARETDLYEGNIITGSVGFSRRFTDEHTGAVDWTLEQSDYSKISHSLVNSPFAKYDTSGINYFNSILSLSWTFDRTDDFFNPTGGMSLKGIVEEAGLFTLALKDLLSQYKTTEYVKLEGLGKWFADLSRNKTSILGLKLRVGGIFRWGDTKASDVPIPFNRRYYAGGSTSVRGWPIRELAADTLIASFGGNSLVESSLELRWKAFPGSKKFLFIDPTLMWFVFFVDAGNLWSEVDKMRADQFAMAFGIGLRYNIIVPLRIDFGMKLFDPTARSHRWMWDKRFFPETVASGILQLGIGNSF